MAFTSTINWSNVTDPTRLLQTANTGTNGSFWTVACYLVFTVILLALLPFGFEVAVLTSAFAGLTISLMLVYAELMAWEGSLFFIGLILFYIIYITWSSGRDR